MQHELPLNLGTCILRSSTMDDAEDLGPRLNYENRREVEAAGFDGAGALRLGIENGIALTAEVAGKPEVMLGVAHDKLNPKENVGVIWLLGSNYVDHDKAFAMTFLRMSRPIIDLLAEPFEVVHNSVPAEHERTVRWLKWCGFTFLPQHQVIDGLHFVPFVRCAPGLELNIVPSARPVTH